MPASPADKFLKKHKPLPAYREFSAADRKRLSKRLPSAMLAILDQAGWSAFDEQAIWLTDPEQWEEMGRPWLPETATECDVLLRSSFGDMVAWDGDVFWLILPQSLTRVRQTASSDWLFGSTLQQTSFHLNTISKETADARKKAGELKPDEIYSYAPALPLGGSAQASEIERGDAAATLAILGQLGPVRAIDV